MQYVINWLWCNNTLKYRSRILKMWQQSLLERKDEIDRERKRQREREGQTRELEG